MSALLLAIPLTIFVLFVAPIWLWLHYSNRQQTGIQLSQQEMQRLAQLAEDAKRMRGEKPFLFSNMKREV